MKKKKKDSVDGLMIIETKQSNFWLYQFVSVDNDGEKAEVCKYRSETRLDISVKPLPISNKK